MNKKLGIAVGVIVVLVAGAFFYFYNSASAAVGNLNIYNGSAEVVHGGATIPGTNGTAINLSDVINVGADSRVSIILKDGTEVRLEAGTRIAVSDITYNGAKLSSAVFDLTSGEAWSHVAPLASGGTFEVETPTVVATVRGTNFDVSYGGAVSNVHVSTHAVWIALRSDLTHILQLNAGDFILIHDNAAAADFAAGAQSNFTQNDWSTFNENLDAPVESDPSATVTSTPATPTTTTQTPPKPTPPPAATSSQPASGPVLKSLTLSVQNASINQNETLSLTVMANYSSGAATDVTKQVAWQLSPALNIVDTQGNLHGTFVGTTVVTAMLGGVKSNSLTISVQAVQQQPVTLRSITVSCQKIGGSGQSVTYYSLPTAQCAAAGTYSNDSTQDVSSQVNWAASGTAAGAIDTTGYYRPESQGTATITAILGNITGSAQIAIP